ncbi:mas-related G-protein coupled receptor member X1-like [Heteronotia binoei]|uniref:mas-related G-protein coupled receptor member X1-like n=1 Tax=Heteronotia binoei TaxID=13085 RepID=UPI00292E43D9|nr:mas-related G-protein coupled receptor member X1-like [Heteronotia binoei]
MDCDASYDSIRSIAVLTCVFGCAGNGCIIWLLGFCIKKTAFSMYVLHLTMADLGTVTFLAVSLILIAGDSFNRPSSVFLLNLFLATWMAGLCFLITISTERCASVLFPHWYQRRRPKCLSTRLSFVVWMLSGMFYGMEVSFYLVYGVPLEAVTLITSFVNFWILPSLVAICAFVLLIGLCCRHGKHPLGSLNMLIILMLVFFLVLGGPCVVVYSLCPSCLWFALSDLFFAMNSSIRPIFYYFLGKQWKCRSTEPLNLELQRIFQDEGNATEGGEPMRVNLAEETCSVQTA